MAHTKRAKENEVVSGPLKGRRRPTTVVGWLRSVIDDHPSVHQFPENASIHLLAMTLHIAEILR